MPLTHAYGSRPTRGLPGVVAGFLFGAVLFVFAFFSAGFGHGSYLQASLFAAPISFVPVGSLAIPIWWAVVGGLLWTRRHRAVVIALAIHTAFALVVLFTGTPNEPGGEQWRYFRETMGRSPLWMWSGLALYGAPAVRLVPRAAVASASGSTLTRLWTHCRAATRHALPGRASRLLAG